MTEKHNGPREEIAKGQSQRDTVDFYAQFSENGGELYLKEIRRFAIGHYEPMVEALSSAIEYSQNKPILDLGCGVGNIEEELFAEHPDIKFVCVDNSERMIKAAEERNQPNKANINFICHDILTLETEGNFKTVFSNLAIHNLSNDEKKKLVTKVYNWLEPGGTFVWGDFMDFEDKEHGEEVMENRRKKILQSEGVNVDFANEILDKESKDDRLTIAETITLLKEVGFEDIEVVWEQDFLAVMKAKKN